LHRELKEQGAPIAAEPVDLTCPLYSATPHRMRVLQNEEAR
jgi:hypothetical protein